MIMIIMIIIMIMIIIIIIMNHGPLQQSWKTKTKQTKQKAVEMRCYRKILRIFQKDHVANEEACVRSQQIIGPHVDLPTIVKRRKLKWYGRVSRSSALAKTILQGKWKGEEDKADRRSGGKTTTGNDRPGVRKSQQAMENRANGSWLWSHLRCPNDPCG